MADGLDPDGRAAALARYYDLDTVDISYDAELYQQLAHEAGGPVLELAVGSGRLGIPLALAGHEVVGIDNDRAMLARAGRTWQRVRGDIDAERLRLIEADFTTYRDGSRYAFSFLAVNTMLLMQDDAERLKVLETMKAHLRPGGIATVELSTPHAAELNDYDGRLQLEWLRVDPETGDEVTKMISARYDSDGGVLSLTQIYETTPARGGPLTRVAKTDLLHLIAADHLADLAERAGFAQVELRGDHLPTPYGARSHRAILVARLL